MRSRTLDATNDRYINDGQIAQALASQLAKININLKVNLIPKANLQMKPLVDKFLYAYDIDLNK